MTTEEHHAAFSRWLDEHAAVLHHVANGFAAGADRQDLMQELLLAMWRAIPAFRAGAKPSTFIFKVAHNTALTWKRTQRNYAQRIDRFEVLAGREMFFATGISDREHETLEALYACIRELPPLDRSLVVLHLDGASYAEIGEIHGLKEGNVGARLSRLKQKLSSTMQEITHELR